MHAVRNIRLCTKDCLCLYVCPTGATDTETGQIDAEKCQSGCRVCVDACPSGAISLVPDTFPPQQEKSEESCAALMALAQSKAQQEAIAAQIAKNADDGALYRVAQAVRMSNRIMAEDLIREADYMLPQSAKAKAFLRALLDGGQPDDFPREAAEKLLVLLER